MGNITLIPNQPIIFYPADQASDSCGCDDINFQQPIDQTDITSIQFLVDPCPGVANIICNSDFDTQDCWNILKGWSIAAGIATKPVGTSGTMRYDNATEVGKLYQIEINIQSLIGTLDLMSSGQLIKQFTVPGIYTFNFVATGLNIEFFMTGNNNDFCELASVTLFPISESLAYGIINSAGSTVSVVAYQTAPETFCFSGRHVTINIDWAALGLDSGCYRIGLTNGCTNNCGQNGVPNGSFLSSEQYWEETIIAGTPTSTFTGSQLNVTGTTNDEVEFLNTKLVLCTAKEYLISVDILKLGNAQLTVQMGTQTAVFNAQGLGQTATITSDGTQLTLIFEMTGATSQLYLGAIEISLVNNADYSFDYESVPIKLDTYSCTEPKLSMCNDDDAWSFAFEGACFFPKIRVPAQVRLSGYPTERELNEFNNGNREVQWAERRKVIILRIGMVPEYVLDFLSLIPSADHFYIDDVEYISEDDEISVSEVADTNNQYNATVNLSEKSALYNVNKGNTQNSCDPPGIFVADKPTDSIVTSPALERVITP